MTEGPAGIKPLILQSPGVLHLLRVTNWRKLLQMFSVLLKGTWTCFPALWLFTQMSQESNLWLWSHRTVHLTTGSPCCSLTTAPTRPRGPLTPRSPLLPCGTDGEGQRLVYPAGLFHRRHFDFDRRKTTRVTNKLTTELHTEHQDPETEWNSAIVQFTKATMWDNQYQSIRWLNHSWCHDSCWQTVFCAKNNDSVW